MGARIGSRIGAIGGALALVLAASRGGSAQELSARAGAAPPRESATLAALVEASGFEGVIALQDVASGARWVSDPDPRPRIGRERLLQELDGLARLQAATPSVGAETREVATEWTVVERDGDHVLRAKSRSAPSAEGDLGSWVGWVERGERTFLFATCLLAKGSDVAHAPACEAVTRGALQLFDALPDPHGDEAAALLAKLFPQTSGNASARSVPLTPWTRHRVFTYSHFTWPHIPSARGAFDRAGELRLISANPGVARVDPIAAFNALAREEELTIADDAAADRYARFALDSWLVGFTAARWFSSAEAAAAANRARLAGSAWRRPAGPLGLVATASGWRLEGAWIEEGFAVCHVIALELRRDGTIELSTRFEDLAR